MPVRSIKNQYLGVNAHLHSYWQAEGGWNNFHNRHIGDLTGMLRLRLLPMGYTAVMEESLQIRRLGDSSKYPRSDILITDLATERTPYLAPSTASEAQLTVAEMLDEEDREKPYRAITIHKLDDMVEGEPIAWIELLSPTNKGYDSDAQIYLAKRKLLLENSYVFVEIDYLHETPPTFSRWPDYSNKRNRPENAYPYRIVVLDPRPDIQTGPANPNEFNVDAPIPVITIPLSAGNVLHFDFGAAYRKTFEEMAYGLEYVDYAQFPAHFDCYSMADQTRITRRMLAVLKAERDGIDLETEPFLVKEIGLDEALTQIEALKQP